MIMEVEEVKEAEQVEERQSSMGCDRKQASDRVSCNAVANRGCLSFIDRVRR
jgi:hypothetical protein